MLIRYLKLNRKPQKNTQVRTALAQGGASLTIVHTLLIKCLSLTHTYDAINQTQVQNALAQGDANLIIVDDNLYYRSMRYTFCQVALKEVEWSLLRALIRAY